MGVVNAAIKYVECVECASQGAADLAYDMLRVEVHKLEKKRARQAEAALSQRRQRMKGQDDARQHSEETDP